MVNWTKVEEKTDDDVTGFDPVHDEWRLEIAEL